MKQDSPWKEAVKAFQQAIDIIIEVKFGEAGQDLRARVDRIQQLKTLQNFAEKIKHAQSLSEAEKIFGEILSNGHNGANGRSAARNLADRGK